MALPSDLLFTDEHEWIKIEDKLAYIGITEHAQHALGDVVFLELPKVGSTISQKKAIGVVESVKAVSDIYAPISGVVKEVNQKVILNPEIINQDPYGEGWLIKVELSNALETKDLLKPEAYQHLLAREAK